MEHLGCAKPCPFGFSSARFEQVRQGNGVNAGVPLPATGSANEASDGLARWGRPLTGSWTACDKLVLRRHLGLPEKAAPSWARTAGAWAKQMDGRPVKQPGEPEHTWGPCRRWRLSSPGSPCFLPGGSVPWEVCSQ